MPERPYFYARQRVQATEAEIQDEFVRAQQALVDQMNKRPAFERDGMKAWFVEVADCWDYYFRLFRDLERRWRAAAAPTVTAEEAEAVWRYWNAIERKGKVIR